jgi:tetratricopeptide (TPR) repeat protein
LDADIVRGSIAADRGELDEAMRYTQRGLQTAESVGNTFCDLTGNLKIADQHLRLGEVDLAIGHLEKSTGLAQYCNAGGYEALAHAWLAAARARRGDAQLDDFDAPLASAVASGSRSTEGLVRLQRAITLSAMGDPDGAAPDFERAIELFAEYGGLPNLARAHGAFAQALQAGGRSPAAQQHAQIAEDLFAQLGIRPDAVASSGSASGTGTPA